MQAAVGEVEEQEENLARRKEKRREERENRVSEDHSNINVPGPEKRRHSLIKKLEKLIHISLGARGLCYSSFNPWYLIGHLFPAISNLAPLPVFFLSSSFTLFQITSCTRPSLSSMPLLITTPFTINFLINARRELSRGEHLFTATGCPTESTDHPWRRRSPAIPKTRGTRNELAGKRG